jgi:2-oxoisovalerate dehydrogenase E2 component (dihydrolipoyl transacylase)
MEKQGIKLSYMPFFIKAASMALRSYPIINSSFAADASQSGVPSQVVLKWRHNIGIAMDTPNGLVVPNIKDVQSKSIIEIAADLSRLMDLGAKGRLSGEDLKGGTFTLSNVGAIGGTYAAPVLVAPEVCIGALGKVRKLPRFVDPNGDPELGIKADEIMQVSWSADHRIVDGATIARFSNEWKDYLENPQKMLLTLK